MEFGLSFFYFYDGDHEPRVENDELLLEVWFKRYVFPHLEDKSLRQSTITSPDKTETVTLVKHLMAVPLHEVAYVICDDGTAQLQREYVDTFHMNVRTASNQ
jgi:hypothetical protein